MTPVRYTLALVAASCFLATRAVALDAPTVSVVTEGFAKTVLTVTAGASGAPHGFSVWWMAESDYSGTGWIYSPTAAQRVAAFTGSPTLNTWGGTVTTFVLQPFESVDVEIGDLADETGVWSNAPGELEPGTSYVFCASANDPTATWYPASPFSPNDDTTTRGGQDCTFTQGYWKTHPSVWPATSLMLGTVSYDQAQLLSILGQPVAGNGLVSLAHQLIATKLNLANGSDGTAVVGDVAGADALIGALVAPPVGSGYLAPSSTSSATQALDDYNNGLKGPGHCSPVSVEPSSWGRAKISYR